MADLIFSLLAPLGEFFAELLVTFLIEFLVPLLFELLLSGLSRLLRRFILTFHRMGALTATLLLIVAGSACGALSVLILAHPLVHPSRFHGISLLFAPPLVALAMARLGHSLRYRNYRPVRLESFGYAYACALAFSLTRFLLLL